MLSHVLGGPPPKNCHGLANELEKTRFEIMKRPDAFPHTPRFIVDLHDHPVEGAAARFEQELIDAIIAELPSDYQEAIGQEKKRLEMLYAWPSFRRAKEIDAGLCEGVCRLRDAIGEGPSALASQDRIDAARAASEITLGSEKWIHKQVVNLLLYAWGEHPRFLNLTLPNERNEFNRLRGLFDETKTKTVKPKAPSIEFNDAVRNRLVALLPQDQRRQYSSLIGNPNLADDYALKKEIVMTWLHGFTVQLSHIQY